MIASGRNFLLAASLCALSACGYVEKDDWMPVHTGVKISKDIDLATRALSGNTIWTIDAYHGAQYEFLASDGTTQLWYPGNRSTVSGEWQVREKQQARHQLCFRYGENSYNPVTKQQGGQWECAPMSGSNFVGEKIMLGDPFDLSSGEIPYVMERRDYDRPKDVAQKVGLDPNTLDYLTNLDEL